MVALGFLSFDDPDVLVASSVLAELLLVVLDRSALCVRLDTASVLPLPVAVLDDRSALACSCSSSSISIFSGGTKRSSSPTFSSPSRMGRKQRRSSWVDEALLSCCCSSALPLSELEVLLPEPVREDRASPLSSSSVLRVRMEDVTSHQTVLRSFLITQILHVGASGLGLLDPSLSSDEASSLAVEESSLEGTLSPDSR